MMRHIKNFLHNINDIVLAIVIVVLAAGIIYWRMQIILDYPKLLADQQPVQTEETQDGDAAADEETSAEAEDQTPEEEPAEDSDEQADDASEEQPQG